MGAVSFEARCVGSLRALHRLGTRFRNAVIVDYPTATVPRQEGDALRDTHRTIVQELTTAMADAVSLRTLGSAYSFVEFGDVLDVIGDGATVVVDISCLTKVHVLACAAAIARLPDPSRVTLAYAVPENYNFGIRERGRLSRWCDIVVAPLTDESLTFSEATSRGVLIVGHESDRVEVALAEILPTGGTVVITSTEDRPDFQHLTEARNQRIMKKLLRFGRWTKSVVRVDEPATVQRIVSKEIALAQADYSPVVLFPFGAKPLIFAVAYQLLRDYPQGSWFVYPIPTYYNADYSFGIGDIRWFGVGELTGGTP